MKFKKILGVILVGMLLISLVGCSSNQPAKEEPKKDEPKQAEGKYEDGIYFAQEKQFNEKTGWKYVVTLEVKDGKIVKADWNGAHRNGGPDKDTLSKNGKYPLVEKGGAQAPWHEQAEKAEAYLIEKQDPTAIAYKDDEGHTDDIAGVSINVKEFFKLAQEALEKGPVGSGKYKDGAYYAQEEGYSKGWKYTASLTVINGYIVAADWNGININGGKDKDTLSKDGEYGLVAKGGAQAEWHEQAQKAEAYLLEKQDPTAISYKDDEGHTDDIAGVSINVKEFFKLAEKALAKDPIPVGQYNDGFYHAEQKEFNEKTGWKYTVNIAVKNGTIVGVDWTGVHKDGGDDKDTLSRKGEYGLVAKGGAQAEWHEQAAKAEAYLLETQDPTKINYKDDKGHTDDIAGVTIGVGEFFELAQEALADAK
jgi:major membrane immunogen (membrane-anchored lipoprotein)